MKCRVCKKDELAEVLDLGIVAFTGVFPSTVDDPVDEGRLVVGLCDSCGLAQLADSFPLDVLYGDNYGYRSGLNQSMVNHLRRTINRLERLVTLEEGDVVLDIGANDGTLLRAYSTPGILRVGIDPTIAKFFEFYAADSDIVAVPAFFSAGSFHAVSPARAKVITSIAMFYDLEDPVAFAQDIGQCLTQDGLWHFEQSYMPWMLRSGAYDTICHEHLEYYSLSAIVKILDAAGLKLVDVSTNAVNGGSIAVTAAKVESEYGASSVVSDWILENESRSRVSDVATWTSFAATVKTRQDDLLRLLKALNLTGHRVMGLGASTKGNVLLQTTGVTRELVSKIGDVNPYKHGRFMPGTGIPIVSEDEVLADNPDYLLVLPWHFRETFMTAMEPFMSRGGRLIFPLPDIEVVGY